METSRKHQYLKKNRHALDQRYRAFAEAFMDIGKPTFQRVVPSAIAAGYSESYARGLAYKLLDNIGVQKWIAKIRQQREKLDAAPAEEVLRFLTSVMRGDPAELERSKEEGEGLRVLREMTAETRRALVAGVKRKTRFIPNGEGDPITEHTIEYKLNDRLKAARMLAQHLGLLVQGDKLKQVENNKVLVGYPTDPMPLAEWERQVREMLGYEPLPMHVPASPVPQGG